MSSSEKCLLRSIHSWTWLERNSAVSLWVFSHGRAHTMCRCWWIHPFPYAKWGQGIWAGMGAKLEKCSKQPTLMERSTEPLTSLFPLRFKHLTVPECPARVKTTSESSLLMSHTLIVLSYEPLAILVSSNWTQEIPVKKSHLIIIERAVSQN